MSSRSKHKVILLLASLLGFVGTQGLFCLSTLTPGFNFNKSLCLSFKITAGFSPPLLTRLSNSGMLSKSKQVFQPSQFSVHLKSSRKEGSRTLSTNKLLVPASPSLDTSWRCRNHSSITYFKSSKVPKSFLHYIFQIIKGHLCPTALAFGSLRKLGWMHQSLESHRGNLHKVFFAQGFFASMVFFCIRSVSMSTGSFGVARICWKRKHEMNIAGFSLIDFTWTSLLCPKGFPIKSKR